MRATLMLVSFASAATAADPACRVVRLDERLDAIIAPDASVEIVASGFEWSEGPVWDPGVGRLLFSDVPRNSIFAWQDGREVEIHLANSGGSSADDTRREPGSNGLTFDNDGRLIVCQHAARRVARLLDDGSFETVADRFEGRRFNSPNDLVVASDGTIYFTDPPYGLPKKTASEIGFCGVYRVTPDGAVSLVTQELRRPNGVSLSPDESILYVANSDPEDQKWVTFSIAEDGTFGPMRLFVQADMSVGVQGCDGLKVDRDGVVFATGPGGVWVFSPAGEALGRIETGERIANCAFGGDDGTTLFMTSDMHIARVETKTVDARGVRGRSE
ncbi:MAG: SMP-30/gluconolactonase/LRE family protein [Planctomycetota bacterium]